MKIHAGVYDTNPETASEFPHGPVIEMDDGRSIYFDLHMEVEADICLAALGGGTREHFLTKRLAERGEEIVALRGEIEHLKDEAYGKHR